MSLYAVTAIWGAADVALILWLVSRVPRERFLSLKWPFVAASALFWGLFATVLIWSYWESYYSFFAPAWQRLASPLAAVFYGVVGLGLWWLAGRLPGSGTLNLVLLGGLESIPEHILGIYVMGILSIPMLAGITAGEILLFAVFEYILYWSLVLGLAVGLQDAAQWWGRRGKAHGSLIR